MKPSRTRSRLAGLLAGALLALAGSASAADARLDDGPYVFRHGTQLQARWVCAGEVRERTLAIGRDDVELAPVCAYPHPLRIGAPASPAAARASVADGGRLIAVSDIHGQFDLLRRLLRAHHVIDAEDRWAAGRDTLVITGDVFDRGPDVTAAFWLLHQLQQQAAARGGAVHFLLGNHETMVLYDDLRYINAKYRESARVLGTSYAALYSGDSVIGDWLRKQSVLLQVGDTLFLHGGIAPESLDLARDMAATNDAYRRSLGQPRDVIKADPATARLYSGKSSPIWYRGYFNGKLDTAEVRALVQRLGLRRIVVGHTTIGEVASFHEGRVVAIDSGIKRGQSGQLLFIEGERLSRGLPDGTREPVPERRDTPKDEG